MMRMYTLDPSRPISVRARGMGRRRISILLNLDTYTCSPICALALTADDDDFNWNYGIALAASADYVAAEDTLLQVSNSSYKSDLYYKSWLARCFIMNGKAASAWKMRSSIEADGQVYFLKVVANDCFRANHFLFAAKAFDALQAVGNDSDYTAGLKSACVGVFRTVVLEKSSNNDISAKSKKALAEALEILQNHLDVDELKSILTTIKHWMRKNITRL